MLSSTFAQEQNATSSEQPTDSRPIRHTVRKRPQNGQDLVKMMQTSMGVAKSVAKTLEDQQKLQTVDSPLSKSINELKESNQKVVDTVVRTDLQNKENLIKSTMVTMKAVRKALEVALKNMNILVSPLVKSQYVFKSHDGTDVIPTASIKDRYNFDMEKLKRDNERAVEEYQRNKNSTETKDTTGDEIKENNTSVPTSAPGVKIRVS